MKPIPSNVYRTSRKRFPSLHLSIVMQIDGPDEEKEDLGSSHNLDISISASIRLRWCGLRGSNRLVAAFPASATTAEQPSLP